MDDKKKNTYYVHTRWGRVGEDGQIKTVTELPLDDAKKEYEKFKDKTGLEWSKRTDTPKNKKYTYVEKWYEEEDDDDDDDENEGDGQDQAGQSKDSVKSELDLPTQRLMELIFKYGLAT